MKRNLVLVDMDGTLLMGRSLKMLTVAFGLEGDLQAIEQESVTQGLTERDKLLRITRLFKGQRIDGLASVFDGVPLTPGAPAWARALHSAGHPVHIVSESWQPLVERLGRRLSVTAVWANNLEIRGQRITGEIRPPLWNERVPRTCWRHSVCKLDALRMLAERESIGLEGTIAVGDGLTDVCMLREAGLGVALNPKAEQVAQAADMVVYGDFYDVADKLAPQLSDACRV